MRRLQRCGIEVGLRGVGAGFSVLGPLAHLPFDAVRLARVYAPNVMGDDAQREAVAGLARSMVAPGRRVIATGVDTAELAEGFASTACDTIEGTAAGQEICLHRFAHTRKGEVGEHPVTPERDRAHT